jgi:hypothetical protein
MRFRRHPSGSCELCDIHPLFAGLIEELPRTAGRHKKARRRLYPDPSDAAAEAEFQRDWDEHVRPGLERLFASSRELVRRDIATSTEEGHLGRLLVPQENIDAWLNALNQARLIIVEENNFCEADLDQHDAPDLATRRGLALLKVHFYAHMQELLVEAAG